MTLEGLPPGKPAQVTIDGEAVPLEALGAPRKVNPGKHVVEVTVGGVTQTKQVNVATGASESVVVTVAPLAATAPAGSPDEPGAPRLDAPVRPAWPWVAISVGAAGAIAGGVFVMLWIRKDGEVADFSGRYDTKENRDELERLKASRNSFGLAALVCGGAGVAAGVVGIWGLTRDPPRTAGTRLLVGVGTVAVRVVF